MRWADRRIVLPGLIAIAGLAVLIGLGTWQLERKAWKDALIATLAKRLAAAADDLPPPDGWSFLDPADHEFRRVSFPAEMVKTELLQHQEARVYTSGSALRDDVKTPGYFAFAPARLSGGSIVVVNRGYVPNPHPNAQTRPLGEIDGVVDLVGVLRWPESPGWFVASHNAQDDLWFVRDPAAMAAAKNWGEVAPFYIELETLEPPGGLPKPGRLKVNLPNNHLQYALTWYGLALVLVVIFAIWAAGRRRERPA